MIGNECLDCGHSLDLHTTEGCYWVCMVKGCNCKKVIEDW